MFTMEQSDGSGRAEAADTDMLSSLPDCLLHHIMSFLTAIEAVQTCILSKRWENLWTTLQVLDFDQPNFEDMLESWYGDGREVKAFKDFVNMTLLLRKPIDLRKFRLYCPNPGDFDFLSEAYLRSWIRYVIDKNPQVLDICCHIMRPLLGRIFNCASLVDLSLYFISSQISAVNLPCLRRLYLDNSDINQDFMKKLLCGCPVFESLHLMYCNMEISTVHSLSLRYLTIETRCKDWEACIVMESINAPNLLYFSYIDCGQYIRHKINLNMPSLTCAILFREKCLVHPPDNGTIKILTGISSVTSLKLGGLWMKDLLQIELPNFQNVKDLSITDFCLFCNLNLLASFLKHFPILEILSFWHDSLCKVEVDGDQESLKLAPFECKHLHTINVNFLAHNNNDVHKAMKYLEDCTKDLSVKINITGCSIYPPLSWRRVTP